MEVEVAADNGFDLGERRVVYSTPNLYGWSSSNSYDVAGDDSRFLVILERGGVDYTQLIVVLKFFEELKRPVPNLKPQIPWLRALVEGVVIVSSILLVFGI